MIKRIAFVVTIGLLFWGTAALADLDADWVEGAFDNSSEAVNPGQDDTDGDGDYIGDAIDNCSEAPNPMQDDTDGDDCGNICDADYNQDGAVSFADFGYFTGQCFGNDNPVCDHTEPVGDGVIGFGDFGRFTWMFGSVPGPSGPTTGTIACP